MVLEDKSKIAKSGYTALMVYIPKAMATDSQFPFKPGDTVALKIENGKLIISKEGQNGRE